MPRRWTRSTVPAEHLVHMRVTPAVAMFRIASQHRKRHIQGAQGAARDLTSQWATEPSGRWCFRRCAASKAACRNSISCSASATCRSIVGFHWAAVSINSQAYRQHSSCACCAVCTSSNIVLQLGIHVYGNWDCIDQTIRYGVTLW